MRRWISALAPTSMPRVGSSRMRILRLGQQPAADQHLLLVAAGEVLDRLVHARRLDPQRVAHLAASRGMPVLLDEAARTKLSLQHRDLHVLEHARCRKQPVCLRSSVRNAMPWLHRVVGECRSRTGLPRISMVPRSPASRRNRLGDVACGRSRPARQRRGSRPRARRTRRPGRRPSSAEVLTESTTSPIGTVSLGNIWVSSRPTIMRMMSSRVDVCGRLRADIPAVAEHRDLVGDLEDLVHLVGDVDDALASRAGRG